MRDDLYALRRNPDCSRLHHVGRWQTPPGQMETMVVKDIELANLCRRLREVKEPGYVKHTPTNTFTSNAILWNRDGRAAADKLEALSRENAALREANEGIAWALDNQGYPDTAKLLRAVSLTPQQPKP